MSSACIAGERWRSGRSRCGGLTGREGGRFGGQWEEGRGEQGSCGGQQGASCSMLLQKAEACCLADCLRRLPAKQPRCLLSLATLAGHATAAAAGPCADPRPSSHGTTCPGAAVCAPGLARHLPPAVFGAPRILKRGLIATLDAASWDIARPLCPLVGTRIATQRTCARIGWIAASQDPDVRARPSSRPLLS